MSKSAPSFQFYPGDWLRNDVSGCSLEAQGLWLRMMIIMHDAQIYGQLILNNEPMSPEFIAKKVGISPKKYANLVKELEFAGVINRKENGIIFSGRMERDEVARQQNRDRQAKYRDEHSEDSNGNSNGEVTEEVTDASRPNNNALHLPLLFPIPNQDFKRLIETCVRENSSFDPKAVEAGIYYTLLQRNGDRSPINSLNYFLPQIKRVAAESKNLKASGWKALMDVRREQVMKSGMVTA